MHDKKALRTGYTAMRRYSTRLKVFSEIVKMVCFVFIMIKKNIIKPNIFKTSQHTIHVKKTEALYFF